MEEGTKKEKRIGKDREVGVALGGWSIAHSEEVTSNVVLSGIGLLMSGISIYLFFSLRG